MKKILVILMALATFGMAAQTKSENTQQSKKEIRKNYTPEQRAELMSKKMSLKLDLTDAQQKDIKQVFLDMEKSKPQLAQDRKGMDSKSSFEFQNARMDRKIAFKKKMKNILNPEQFERWEKTMEHKRFESQKGSKRFKEKRREN